MEKTFADHTFTTDWHDEHGKQSDGKMRLTITDKGLAKVTFTCRLDNEDRLKLIHMLSMVSTLNTKKIHS